jgi:hypothetical protein
VGADDRPRTRARNDDRALQGAAGLRSAGLSGRYRYLAPKPLSIVFTVRNRISMSSQGEKYLM